MQDINDILAEGKKATAEVRDITLSLAARIKELTDQNTKLIDALKFYANGYYEEGGGVRGNEGNNFTTDYGQIASKALEELNIKD